MITIFCAFIGFLFSAFGYNVIENTTAILLSFLFEVAFEVVIGAIYVIVKGERELKKPDCFFYNNK